MIDDLEKMEFLEKVENCFEMFVTKKKGYCDRYIVMKIIKNICFMWPQGLFS